MWGGVNLRESQDWGYPVPTCYGPGRLKEVGSLCRRAGMTNPLLVTDRGSRSLPFIQGIQGHLGSAGLACGLFAEISPNPRDDEIAAGCAAYRAGGHDGILAVGGGSGMDGAKAICLSVTNDLELMRFEYTRPPPDMAGYPPFPPLITVPTTAGTGAESEATAMITETARMMKWCLAHPNLKVTATLLDPEITLGLPRNLTAWTGCDAMVHAIEAYCVPTFYPLCDGAALEGLRLIWAALPTAVEEPEDVEARGAMLVGSYLAGIAFLKGLGLVHAISHMVGAEYDTHHGLTNAIILPAVLRFNAPAVAGKLGPMAAVMGLGAPAGFEHFYAAVCQRLDQVGFPKTLCDIGVPADCAEAMAEKALEDSAAETNPRPAGCAEIEEIIRVALTEGR